MESIKRQIWSDGSIVYQEKQNKCCSNTIKVRDKDLMIHQLYEIILEQQKQIEHLGELFNTLNKNRVTITDFTKLQKELYKTKYKNLSEILESTERYKIWDNKNIYRYIWNDYLNNYFNSKFSCVEISCAQENIYVIIKKNNNTKYLSILAENKPLIQIVEEVKACIDKNILE